MKQKICVFSICFNEEDMIEFYLDYYINFLKVDKIVICDGGSTDRTHQIISEYPQVELIIEKQDSANDNYLKDKKNTIWKKYKNDFDWVIVCDIDEFLYHPNIHEILLEYKNNNITIPTTRGYDMVSLDFPIFKKGHYLPHVITNGISDDHWLAKRILFDPTKIEEINFRHGAHDCDPIGEVKYSPPELMMLHYKWISYEYLIKKYKFLATRQGDWNIENNACTHWESNSKIIEQDFIDKFNQSVEYSNNFYKIDDTININDLEEIKIAQLKELEKFMINEKNIPLSGDQRIIKIYNKKNNGLTEKLLPYLLNIGYEIISDNINMTLSKRKNKDIYVFSHNYLINNWKVILEEQLYKIKYSGLYKNATKLFLYGYGEDSIWKEFVDIILDYDNDNKIELKRHKDNFYEYYTLQSLWDFSQTIEDSHILYFHLKGVWSRNNIQTDAEDAYNPDSSIKNAEALTQWRKCLEYFNIERWYNSVDKLNDGYEVVGALYNYNELEPLFTGNFWWASSNYIKKLERLRYNVDEEPFAAKIWCRVKCEKWINTIKNHNFYNLYNPVDLDLYHYVINPADYRDDINPLFSILTPTYNRYEELKNAIQSVVDQKYTNWEMLICSDGNDDNVKHIIESYNNPKIQYFFTERTNDWGSTQRNYLTKISKGKYIIYLDDDNIIYSNCLKDTVYHFDEITGIVVSKIDYDGLDHRLPVNSEIKLGKIDTLNVIVDKQYIKYVSWKNYVGHDYEFIKICENNVYNNGKIVKFVSDVIGRHIDKNKINLKMTNNDIDIVLKDKIYIFSKIEINNANMIFRGINGNVICSTNLNLPQNSDYWFIPDDRSYLNGFYLELYVDQQLLYKSDFIRRFKSKINNNKIVVFHHNYLEYNWFNVLKDQVSKLKESGLYENCNKIIATFYSDYKDKENRQLFKDYISKEDYLNKWTLIELYDNEYEYDALKIIKKYSNYSEEDVNICYFHLKGICSEKVTPLNIGIPYWREYLNYFIIDKWKDNLNKLIDNDVVCLDYEFNEMHQKLVLGGHFFWTKSSYIKKLSEPITTNNRYISELWITSDENCKVYSNFSTKSVGINDLYLECILPDMYKKDKIVLVGIAKNEDYYIEEWLKYNHKIGFDHIFLFENNWKCNLDFPFLTKIPWPGERQQMIAYNYFIDTYGSDYDYIAFFDCDEFIVLKKHNNIHEFIKEYGGRNIAINWQFYGSDGKLKRENNSVLKTFTKREPNADRHIKSIIYTKIDQWMELPHNPDKPTYDTNGKEVLGPFNYNGPNDVVVINHYRDKSREDYDSLIARGYADATRLENINVWEERKNIHNDVEDLTSRNFLYGNRVDELLKDYRMTNMQDDFNGYNRLFGLKDFIIENLNKDSVVCEIGSFAGKSSELFALYCKEIHCVDPWHWEWESADYIQTFELDFDKMMSNYNNIKKLKMYSVEASKKFENKTFDCVYIDAVHYYENVKEDILSWIDKVKDDGIISGHDYNMDGVKMAVDEIFKDIPIKVYSDSSWAVKISDLKTNNIDNLWNISNNVYGIQQKENEWKNLLSYIKSNVKMNNILEIGSFSLGSTASFVNLFKYVYSIDIHKGDNWDDFKNKNNNWNYFIGESYSNEIIEKIKNLNIKFDVIFIDGDHTYEGVKKDFYIFKHFLNESGIILFHDIIDTQFHRNANCFVHDFWKEIKQEYEHIEFIDISEGADSNISHKLYKRSDWGGIGVLKNINPDIAVFHHNYLVGNWHPIVEDEIKEIINSGLYEESKFILTTVFSENKEQYVVFKNLIDKYDNLNKWIIKELNENNYEIDCINSLYEYCQNNNAYVLYFNNKGATHDTPTTKSWRDYMIHFNITKYKDALINLKEYDAYGVDLHSHPYLHYSGNFWWSKSEHIRKLSTDSLFMDEFNNKNNIEIGFPMHRRHNCEMWVCSIEGKYFGAWESHGDFYKTKTKIYDCFNFFNELDVLEIRLNVLYEHVDKFIIIEATKSHSGNYKELFFENNKKRFEKFNDKIIHVIADDLNSSNAWVNEQIQKNKLYSIIREFDNNDIIMITDVDEIPNMDSISSYIKDNKIEDEIYGLSMETFYYYLNNKANSGWSAPYLTTIGNIKKYDDVIQFRFSVEKKFIIDKAGWHFSYLGGYENIKLKLNSFTHTEYSNIDLDTIKTRVDNNIDLFGRQQDFEIVNIDDNFPKYILENKEKYNSLIKSPIKVSTSYNNSKSAVYIITSHPNYKMSEDITIKTLKNIREFGEKIILSAHCPVSTEIQKLVDYFIYDKNNPLIKHDFYTQSWFSTDEYYALLNITKNENNFNHALGVFLNYYNSLILAKQQGFKTAVCTNFDMVFSLDDMKSIDNKIDKMYKNNRKAFFMNTPEREGTHYKTIFFITNIDYFLETFKYIDNEKLYTEEMKKVNSNTNCLENFFYHSLKNETNNLLLEEINEEQLFPTSQINLFSLIEYNTILSVEDCSHCFVIWFSSANSLDSRDFNIIAKKNGRVILDEIKQIDKKFVYYKRVKFTTGDIFDINFRVINGSEILKNKYIKVDDEVFNNIKSYGKFIDKIKSETI